MYEKNILLRSTKSRSTNSHIHSKLYVHISRLKFWSLTMGIMRTTPRLLCLLVGVQVADAGLKTVYGSDNRQDEIQTAAGTASTLSNAVLSMGAATVALVSKSNLACSGQTCTITSWVGTSSSAWGTQQCDGSWWPFASQKLVAFCSGTLVSASAVATAGHCIPTPQQCASTYVVFGLTATAASAPISASNVFTCSAFIGGGHAKFLPQTLNMFSNHLGGPHLNYLDAIVISLDRAVPASVASPATVAPTAAKVSLGDAVWVIGHPSGMPRKYSRSTVGYVGKTLPYGGYEFGAQFSTFGGNSGSGGPPWLHHAKLAFSRAVVDLLPAAPRLSLSTAPSHLSALIIHRSSVWLTSPARHLLRSHR